MPGGAGAVGGAEDRQHPRPGAPLGLHPGPAPRPVCPLFTPLPGRQGDAHLHVSAFSTASGLPDATVRVGRVRVPWPLSPSPGRADITSSTFCPGGPARPPLTQGQNDLGVGGVVVLKVDAFDRPPARGFFEEVELFSLSRQFLLRGVAVLPVVQD